MGELILGQRGEKIGCHGLGSCIALMAFDPRLHIGAVVHAVLPSSNGYRDAKPDECKYLDFAVANLLAELTKQGSRPYTLRFAAVGGANIFRFGVGSTELNLAIGQRNINALQENLSQRGIRISGESLGGTKASSTYLCLESGQVFVASSTREFTLLCDFMEGNIVKSAA
jgi:chemotaxis protein CheD